MVDLYIYIVLILIDYVLCAEYASLSHELGHFRKASAYAPTKARICVRCHLPMPKVENVEIVKDNSSKDAGYIELENDFLPYTGDQISEIAKAGHRGALQFFLATTAAIQFAGAVVFFAAGGIAPVFAFFSGCIWLLCAVQAIFCIIAYVLGKNKPDWSDYKIAKDPLGFRRARAKEMAQA